MTFTYITLVVLLILLVGIVRKMTKARQSRKIGAHGEASIAHLLNRLPRATYHVLNDLMLRKGDGRTAQIDHVVISPYGIFVIETKFRHGRIHASAATEQWTQHIGHKTHQFESPIRQNKVHIRTIHEHLPFVHLRNVHSLIVFPNETELHVGNAPQVVLEDKLIAAIRKHNLQVLSNRDIESALDILQSHDIQGAKARRHHVRDVKAHHE